jgi:hypothetical protein
MNTAQERLVRALHHAADAIERGEPFEWGHVGRCVVGHVVQHLASMSDRDIFSAFDRTLCQWREHAAEYFDAAVGDEPLASTESARDWCKTAGKPLAEIYRLFSAGGLDAADIGHMEFLSDPRVLANIPPPKRWNFRPNNPQDAALYLRTYARVLTSECPATE